MKRLHFTVTTRKNLTVREFDQVIDSFEATAKDAEVALFFFSGHGVQIDKRGYLAPVDIKAESESSALRELVAIQEIVSRIENAAKVSVIVLDACRDSPLQERLRRVAIEKNRAILPPKGLPPVSVVGSNTLIVYATSPGETASDGSSRNSPFTASLLRNIETPGLEIELMFKRVTRDVLNETHGKQQPERLSRLQNEVMLAPPSTEGRPQLALNEAAQNWSRIKDLQDPKIFEDFLDRYGSANPDYGALASRRIEELRRSQTAFTVPPKLSSAPGRTFPRGRDLSLSNLREMGRSLSETKRKRVHLSLDWLRRRSQADRRQNGCVRCDRCAARSNGSGGRGPYSMADGAKRDRACGKSGGYRCQRDHNRRSRARKNFPWHHQDLGRSGAQETEPER